MVRYLAYDLEIEGLNLVTTWHQEEMTEEKNIAVILQINHNDLLKECGYIHLIFLNIISIYNQSFADTSMIST